MATVRVCTSKSATTSVRAPWKWFEGPIYRFINRKNEASMRALSDWLAAHPEYRADLAVA